MTVEHKTLAEGRWFNFSFCTQMANIGSEVERTIIWQRKQNLEYKKLAFYRALELIDLTMRDPKNLRRLKEIARLREFLADFFVFDNEYKSTEQQWQKYFLSFNYAARIGR